MVTAARRTEKQENSGPPRQQRLQKVLAAAGLGSRRQCEEYILAGRVTVDGHVVDQLGATVDPERQEIEVDGEPIRPQRKVYYLLNKPPGVLCTHRDPAGRCRVIDLFPADGPRLFTVGRLDENSQGLLIVTNDGELANQLAHPRYRIPRKYRVQVAGIPTQETLNQLKRGLYFAEGKFRAQSVRRVRTRGHSAVLEIVLAGGHNREIRRLLARVGHKVMRLERIAYGPLKLGRLPVGRYRPLKKKEVEALRDLCAKRTRSEASDASQGSRPGSQRRRR
ncbi:MAG TPA: rRNA pseudouridine synthase [Planctomycetaceae bacterium]|nr:rRNA pseudouridine synthase [Planctomycetaceae bacterium]